MGIQLTESSCSGWVLGKSPGGRVPFQDVHPLSIGGIGSKLISHIGAKEVCLTTSVTSFSDLMSGPQHCCHHFSAKAFVFGFEVIVK